MSVKHKCPTCTCTFPTSRAEEFEPALGAFLGRYLEPTGDTAELTTNDIYSTYAAWCRQTGQQPKLTQSRLTRHLRFLGYPFKHYGTMNKLIGYRLAS